MNKKGSILIEILAVILIAIPTVNNVIEQLRSEAFDTTVNNIIEQSRSEDFDTTVNNIIEQSRSEAFDTTVSSIIKTIKNDCKGRKLNGEDGITIYSFEDGKVTPALNINGNLPKEGYAITNLDCQVRISVYDDSYYVEKDFKNDEYKVLFTSEKNKNVKTNKEILVNNLTTNPSTNDYKILKSSANESNSIIVKVHAAKKNYTRVGNTFNDTKSSHKWVVAVHGYIMNEFGISNDLIKQLQSLNYNVVVPRMYYWGDGTNPVHEDFTWGWSERFDVEDVINYIISFDNDAKIVLYGGSMGGATVSMVSGDLLPSNVKGIIEDSGYASLNDEIDFIVENNSDMIRAHAYNLYGNAALSMTTEEIYTGYMDMLRQDLDVEIDEVSSIEQVRKASIPMLFMHGSADEFVNPNDAQKMYDAANMSKKYIYISKDACHTCASYMPEYFSDYLLSIKKFLSAIGME